MICEYKAWCLQYEYLIEEFVYIIWVTMKSGVGTTSMCTPAGAMQYA